MPRALRAQQPACHRGHPFPENLRIEKRGRPTCRICHHTRYGTDPIAIDRAVHDNNPPPLTPQERATAVHRLDRLGLSARQIAERLGCTKRTVHRIRNRAA